MQTDCNSLIDSVSSACIAMRHEVASLSHVMSLPIVSIFASTQPHRYHDDGDAAAHDLSMARVVRMNARSAVGTARDGQASAAPTARATESMSQRAEEELASEDGGEGKFAGLGTIASGVAAGATTGTAGGTTDFKWIRESSRGSVLVAESAVEERRGAGPRTSPRPYSGGRVEPGDIYKVEELHNDN